MHNFATGSDLLCIYVNLAVIKLSKILTNVGIMSLNTVGAFSGMPLESQKACFQRSADFLELADIGRCERVCILWNGFCKDQEIWFGLSIKMGIPIVDAKDRDRKADFQVLYPRTISKRRIEMLGKMVEEVPLISVNFFNKLFEQDSFEIEKKMRENYWVFVVPSRLERTDGAEFMNGEQDFALSVPNIKKLCSHLLKGKPKAPVFSFGETDRDEVVSQYGAAPDKIGIYLMRDTMVKGPKRMSFTDHKQIVNNEGFDVVPLTVRVFFDAMKILESDRCPDSDFVCFSDTFTVDNSVCQFAIGQPGRCLSIERIVYGGKFYNKDCGIVPCILANGI